MNLHKLQPEFARRSVAEPLPAELASIQPASENEDLGNPGIDRDWPLRKRMSFRLSDDFRLAVISLFVIIALLTILPFSLFRFVRGEWSVALVDLALLSAIVAGLGFAWRFGRTEWAGNLIATAAIAGVATVIVVFDQSPIWVPTALVASFLLATGWYAAILSVTLIALVAGHDPAFSGSIERWVFLTASVQAALFSHIFSLRSRQHSETLAFLAETDPLTGLGNRRALRHDLTSLVSRNRRQNPNVALALLDLDHFKRVNDEYGHEAGDMVLEDLAAILVQATREHDRCYRFGGEEFVLILQEIDAPGLESALDKLQQRIRADLSSPGGAVTVSIGATLMLPGDTVHACFQRADQAMYKAKASGRDRVEIQ